jgi:hypothetical protein
LYAPGVVLDQRVGDDHEERCGGLHDQKLEDVLLAPISKVLGFLPAGELVRFLAVVKRPEMADLLFVGDHYLVQFAVFELVLR